MVCSHKMRTNQAGDHFKSQESKEKERGSVCHEIEGGGERSSCMMVKKANQAHEKDRSQAEYGVWLKSQSNTASQSTYAFSCLSLHQVDVREQADDFEAQVRESLTFSLPSPLSPSVSASPVSCIYICSDNNQYHPKTPKTTEIRLTTSAKRIHSSIPFTNASSPDGIAS